MGSMIESVDVEVPVRTAYDQWTQFETFPSFMSGVKQIQQLNDTELHWTVHVAGVTREFDARITEQLPDERIAWTTTNGTHNAGVVTFHRLDSNTTRVTLQLEVEPHGVVEQVGDKSGMIGHRVKDDLKRFKTFIEGRRQETGAWRGKVERPQP